MAIKFSGSSAIGNFALVEGQKAADLLKWKQLKVNGIAVGTAPLSISIKDITLEKLFSYKFIINPDKTINLAQIAKTAPAAAAQAPRPGRLRQCSSLPSLRRQQHSPLPAAALAIGLIALKGGKIIFIDRSVSPVHTTTLTDINGTVRDIAPKQGKKAALALDTRLTTPRLSKLPGLLTRSRMACRWI